MKKNHVIPLNWDTEFFGIKCGKVVITAEDSFSDLILESEGYDFISIQNVGNDIRTNKQIAEKSNAYLVDINIQFEKKLTNLPYKRNDENFTILKSGKITENELQEMAVCENDFTFSKFVCDEEMRKRKGFSVYNEWIKNACKEENKYFILCKSKGKIAGYILFSCHDECGKVELVKVAEEFQGKHIASAMIEKIEEFLFNIGIVTAQVGTQLNNIPAMNLYHSLGFRETERTSVFHLWKTVEKEK